ncbi:MAG: hypothetical protein KDD73_07900 [Anaerolineales bacterium]|nr:hypothetical protein [Anaerolineales bacterium]MCB9127169.1 hypothetical protein [Ardenticatenales bacterium]MCB9171929.1 hypothetical protein [Ardenticatenales bacterium]
MSDSPPLTRYLRSGLLGGVVGAAVNLLLFFLTRLLGVVIELPAGPGSTTLAPLSWLAVLFASLVPAVVAALLLMGLNRLTEHGWGYFILLASLILVLSMLPVIVLGTGTAPRLVLAAMHGVAAAATVGALALVGR